MMKKYGPFLAAALLLLTACGGQTDGGYTPENESSTVGEEETTTTEPDTDTTEDDPMNESNQATNTLGAMTPEDALEYMKNTPDLVIVDVAATRWYSENHFEGAINIPIEELDSTEEDALYMELPTGRPVIMHCRLGMIVPGAYARVTELRPDIPEIAYIDGKPPFDEFNEWKEDFAK